MKTIKIQIPDELEILLEQNEKLKEDIIKLIQQILLIISEAQKYKTVKLKGILSEYKDKDIKREIEEAKKSLFKAAYG